MRDKVQEYYGQTLSSSDDLQTNACCDQAPPAALKPILEKLHEEVTSRYYGCGLVAPQLLSGTQILDLGCGSGRDVYLLSALVGEAGQVTGVDMTPEQLAVAEKYRDFHRDAFGYKNSNVRFLQGYIEQLDELGLPDESFDMVVSNCVINLSPDKAAVLREVFRVLKPGGELYFSDVYADRRIPEALRQDPVLYGECLSGALYWNDFLQLARQAGFTDPRRVEDRPLRVDNPDIAARLGDARFFSATYRLFKIRDLEADCENYGQAVIYRGSIPDTPEAFVLDGHHTMEKGKTVPVCGNTWRMLKESRFAPHFEFIGNFSTHYGIFAGCGSAMPFQSDAAPEAGGDSSGGCCG